jgi:hypothetical protein
MRRNNPSKEPIMTRDDIIGMAVEAGFADAQGTVHAAYQLEAFANLVAAHEREKTAKLFDNHNVWDEEVSILIRSQS